MHATTSTTAARDRTGDPVPETGTDHPAGRARDRGRLTYRPGLTGLRAVAVAGVVLAATGRPWIAGGRTAGVEVLFVVSGYLTVTKLVAGDGRPSAGAVTRKLAARTRRVLPALLTLLGGVSLLVLTVQPEGLFGLGSQIRAAVLGVSNWQLIVAADPDIALSPLAHLWPVAVAAQLTVVVAAVLAVVRSPRGRARLRSAAIVLAVASAVALVVLTDGGDVAPRLLYGTDTRASGLLLGAVLALSVRSGSQGRVAGVRGRRLRAVGLLATLGVVATMAVGGDGAGWVGAGGPLLTDALTVIAVAAVVRGAPLGALGSAGMQWIGLRSYAIYLWHWPVALALGGPQAIARPVTMAVYLLVVIVLGDLTYRYVEVPLGATWRVQGSGTTGRTGMALGVAALACGAACAAALLTSSPQP